MHGRRNKGLINGPNPVSAAPVESSQGRIQSPMTHCIYTARIKSNSALSASVAANNKAARLGLLQARPDGWD